jgi:DtxR family manganese transport transcriptional regulator
MSRSAHYYNCEDYLLAVDELITAKGYARVCELAEIFHVQNASVSGMILRLAQKDWVVRRRYRAVTLSDHGRKIVRKLRARRNLLVRFFQKLGLKPSESERELHALEHVLGLKTTRAIRNWLAKDRGIVPVVLKGDKQNGKSHG